MKAVTAKQLKQALENSSSKELMDLCLHLSRFKKENKELLTYLLFEKDNEQGYIESVKENIDEEFELVNTNSMYYIRKSIRKILRNIKKFIRYSKQKDTEIQLLIYFCTKLKHFTPSIKNSVQLQNTYHRQIALIKKAMLTLHEDLQYDYEQELTALEEYNN